MVSKYQFEVLSYRSVLGYGSGDLPGGYGTGSTLVPFPALWPTFSKLSEIGSRTSTTTLDYPITTTSTPDACTDSDHDSVKEFIIIDSADYFLTAYSRIGKNFFLFWPISQNRAHRTDSRLAGL